jgi:hypothetical protein
MGAEPCLPFTVPRSRPGRLAGKCLSIGIDLAQALRLSRARPTMIGCGEPLHPGQDAARVWEIHVWRL